ncbi:MAG: efflux RND transporter periplasmic adaptor subunit [Pseudomonadales bacterium]|nr:efflux RND transporter periplasmic adaptor subunit [Pseudomonadales bacterium]
MALFSQLSKNRFFAPIAVIVLAIGLSSFLVSYQPEIDKIIPAKTLPTIETKNIKLTTISQSVTAYGLVKPHKQIALASEIAGRVIWVSEKLISGGKFDQFDPLIRIENTDYKLQLDKASAENTRAQVDLGIYESDYQRQQGLFKKNLISNSQLDDAYKVYKRAEATLKITQANLEQASLNFQRTEITAPFSGRVQQESIDEGGYLTVGASIATLYADDIVEVRLPISNDDLGFLNWPQQMRGTLSPEESIAVSITSTYGGIEYQWQGQLVRIESEVDPKTRLFHAVAVVKNPEFGEQPPLTVGLFVTAEIAGRSYDQSVLLPRSAVIDNRVLIVNEDNRLMYREIETIRINKDSVLVGRGLNNNELICVTPPSIIFEGMEVNPSFQQTLDAVK